MIEKGLMALNKRASTSSVLICIALFIPLLIAVIYGLGVDPNSVAANNLQNLTITYGEYNFRYEDQNTLSLYSSISDNAREIDGTFRDFSLETPYKVTYTEGNGTPITYTLYMSKNADDCVYVSPDGKYYMMDESIAGQLVIREEFSSLNELKSLPVASIKGFGDSVVIQPDSYTWTYTALDNSMPSLSGNGSADNPLVKFDGTSPASLELFFDKQPDSVTLKITDENGTVAFDDKYENLSASNRMVYDGDTKLALSITAQWYEIDSADCFGQAVYTVPLLYDLAPSYVVVDSIGVIAGDFTVLRITDFNDGEKLKVENDIGIPEEINVYDYKDGIKIAFIPMNCDLEKGTYTLNLKTESGHEKSVKVKVSRAVQHDSHTLLFTDAQLTEAFTQENFEEFESLVSTFTAESRNAHLYDGKFVYPTGSSKLAKGGSAYGAKLEVLSLYTRNYTHQGMQLEAQNGQALTASNNGVVVFADKTGLYGNTVIIDHGCGVLSYYGNLSEISVNLGDEVIKGTTTIGKAGSTGFACVRDGVQCVVSPVTYFATSFDGVFIDPSSPCKYGINL